VSVGTRPAVLEREAEFAELDTVLEEALRGAGRLVVVEGSAGIGKTRLLIEARERAKRAGMRVLAARGTELERDFPFALVRQLFEPALRAADQAEREQLLCGAAEPAGPIVGIAEGAPGAGALTDPSFTTLNALYWLTSNLAEAKPLILAVDDAHWSDAPSLRFFRFRSSRLEDLPAVLMLAARPAEPGADPALLAELVADPATDVIRPRELSQAAVAELVRQGLVAEAEEEFCSACHGASGGNPFMLRELLVELAAVGSRGSAAEAGQVRGIAPPTIQRAVLVRLARLPDSASRLARAVAVLGDDVTLPDAAELACLDGPAANGAADALAAAGILDAGRPLRFVHPLTRNAIYADLSGGAKSAAHKQAAKMLFDRGAEPERVAIHLLATDPADNREAVEVLHTAARRALDRGAPETAASDLRRALAESPPAEDRPELLRLLFRAYFRAGDRPGFEGLLEAGTLEELMAEPQLLLESASEFAHLLHTWGRIDEMAGLLDRATEVAIEAGEDDLAARLQATLAWWSHERPPDALTRLGRFQHLIARDAPAERLYLALDGFWGLCTGVSRARVIELVSEAVKDGRLWREHPDTPMTTVATHALRCVDELDAAERAGADYLSVVGSHASWVTVSEGWERGELALARGEVAKAEAWARTSVDAARQAGFLRAFTAWLALLVEVLVERDDLAGADAELSASGMTAALPSDWWFLPVLFSRARLRLARREPLDALEDLRSLGTIGADAGFRDSYHPFLAYVALALDAAGQRGEARAIAEEELTLARAWALPRRIGIALRTLGLIEGGERGLKFLRESVGVLERSPARLEHARSLAEYGAALRRANRRAEAREPLRTALEWARGTGALAVAQQAHSELEATGEKLRPLEAEGVQSLTPSERRVADLAAEGHTNREIAQSLFVSVKTVETHLSNAYRKLDVGSRGELTSVLS
jgi:DNA-binding CsgD family transcriptional regulator/tetratricopeptide (TPR) repeat protein